MDRAPGFSSSGKRSEALQFWLRANRATEQVSSGSLCHSSLAARSMLRLRATASPVEWRFRPSGSAKAAGHAPKQKASRTHKTSHANRGLKSSQLESARRPFLEIDVHPGKSQRAVAQQLHLMRVRRSGHQIK